MCLEKKILSTPAKEPERLEIMGDFLEFLQTAFVDYWKVWVTGTGTVGFLLFVLAAFERHRDRTISWKRYTAILFSAFWFLATFSAWHDAHRNLTNVISQKGVEASKLGDCNANLRVWDARFQAAQQIISNEQGSVNTLQTGMNVQQNSVNACVQNLITENAPKPLNFVTKVVPLGGLRSGTGQPIDSATVIVDGNQTVTPLVGTLTCSYEFDTLTWGISSILHQMSMEGPPRASRNTYPTRLVSPAFRPGDHLVFLISYKWEQGKDLSCSFALI
jgi:hypothetical protein